MSMKNWTDEELITTRDNLEKWKSGYEGSRSGSKLWLFTAILGAFAISTGLAFIFIDGVTVLSILLIVMGSFTCYSWYKSEKQKNDNTTFLADINSELKRRTKRDAKLKAKGDGGGKAEEGATEDKSKKKPQQARKTKKRPENHSED
jgi:hypothetical protein